MSLDRPIDWSTLFEKIYERSAPAKPGALDQILAPLSEADIAAIVKSQQNPWPASSPEFGMYRPFDPSRWLIPGPPVPNSNVSFLNWADGASWQTGDREFACFGCKHLREYLLAYHVPQYMPGALPFGLDGGSLFGVFDLRAGSSDAVWAVSTGNLRWRDAVRVADSFVDFCRDTTSVGDLYYDHR
jgi:hypothetical protein